MMTFKVPPRVHIWNLNKMGCVPFKVRTSCWEHGSVSVWCVHFWSPHGKHWKDKRHFLNHSTNTAIFETQALNSPLVPNPQQNYQRDTAIWEIYVVLIKNIVPRWRALPKWYSLGQWIPWPTAYPCRERDPGGVLRPGGVISEPPLRGIGFGTSTDLLGMLQF